MNEFVKWMNEWMNDWLINDLLKATFRVSNGVKMEIKNDSKYEYNIEGQNFYKLFIYGQSAQLRQVM